MANILIAGCGYVGGALAQRLVKEGHQVHALRRPTSAPPPAGARVVQAGLSPPETLDALPPNLDFVFYTAGAAAFTDEAYRAAYVDGLQNLCDALGARQQPPRRIFFTSSTGVYQQNRGEALDETSPARPTRFAGKRLLEGEALLAAAPFPATTLRLGGIYGPGRTRLLDSVRNRCAARIPNDTRILNLIHRDDCAGALRHLMQLESPGPLYLAVDHEPVLRNELLEWLAKQLGAAPPPLEEAKEAAPRGGNRRCQNHRLLRTGYTFKFPTYKEGYRGLF